MNFVWMMLTIDCSDFRYGFFVRAYCYASVIYVLFLVCHELTLYIWWFVFLGLLAGLCHWPGQFRQIFSKNMSPSNQKESPKNQSNSPKPAVRLC